MADEKAGEKDLAEAARAILRRARGNSNRAVERMLVDNYKARDAARRAKDDLDEYKKKFPEGATVATSDQQAVLEHLKGLKIENLDQLQKHLSKITDLQGEVEKRDRDVLVKSVSSAEQFPEGTLSDLIESRKIKVVLGDRDVEEGGEKKKKPAGFVEVDGKKVPFVDWIKEHAPDYEKLVGSTGTETVKTTTTTTKRRVPGAGSGNSNTNAASGGGSSLVDAQIAKFKEQATGPNALRPKRAGTTE